MRRFAFRLKSILDLREHIEDQRRLELGAATSRCATLDRDIASRRTAANEALAAPVPEGVSGFEWVQVRGSVTAYAERLRAEAASLATERAKAERDRIEAVERYRAAHRDADVLRKLSERRRDQWHREAMRHEQKVLDDVAQQIHRRRGEAQTHGNAV